MTIREIHIDWTGPHTPEEVKAMNGKRDFGIYQFYGFHPVYGADTLLYIGKSQIPNGTFASKMKTKNNKVRLSNHWTPDEINVFVGKLQGATTPDNQIWSQEIDLAEKLLIFAHSPAWNSQKLNTYFREGNKLFDVHVINWGKHKRLFPEVSGKRYARLYPSNENYKPYSL